MNDNKKCIMIDEIMYNVSKYKKGDTLNEGVAYIMDDVVYPYLGDLEEYEGRKLKTGIYYDSFENKYVCVRPFTKKLRKKYSVKNIKEFDKDYISSLISQVCVGTMEDKLIAADTGFTFKPAITDEDNALQRLVKEAIIKKDIDLKVYSHRFKSDTDRNNHKRALVLFPTMSWDKFTKWAEILDLDYEIYVKDKEGALNPMSDTLKFKSEI